MAGEAEGEETLESYKTLHEKFVSGNAGGSVIEIAFVCATCPIALFLRNVFVAWVFQGKVATVWQHFLVDYVFVVVPGVLCVTLAESRLEVLLSLMILMAISILVFNQMDTSSRQYGMQSQQPWTSVLDVEVCSKRPFITAFRSYTNLATAVFILAVDFTVFPRRFCKTETFGTGLMDVGVGGFIVANAVVSPEARGKFMRARSIGGKLKQVLRATRSTLPLWILGAVRLLAVKGTDYHEHVSEYGVHWNFFFTLAVVRVLSTAVLSFISVNHSWLLSLAMAAGYQYLLSSMNLAEFVLLGSDGTGSRQGLLDANREGIFSCCGYLAIYFAAVQVGKFLAYPRVRFADWLRAFIILVSVNIALWLLFNASDMYVEETSRRMANLSFVIWMLAHQLTFLNGFFLVDLLDIVLDHFGLPKGHHGLSAWLLEAINRNGLFFFMLSNLLTGAVNFSMATVLALPTTAYVILFVYVFVLSVVAGVLHQLDVTVKFW